MAYKQFRVNLAAKHGLTCSYYTDHDRVVIGYWVGIRTD